MRDPQHSTRRGDAGEAAALSATPADTGADIKRIAHRMRQLVTEIRNALARNDTALARHASNLLAPTLAQWQALQPAGALVRPEEALLAREVGLLLDECTEEASHRMNRAAAELRRLRKGKTTIARLRALRVPPRYRRLDARY